MQNFGYNYGFLGSFRITTYRYTGDVKRDNYEHAEGPHLPPLCITTTSRHNALFQQRPCRPIQRAWRAIMMNYAYNGGPRNWPTSLANGLADYLRIRRWPKPLER